MGDIVQTIDYKAIARRFRPQVFSEVTGQDVIVKTLINAIKKNKVSHAYLFCGIRGTGKTTLARLFAKALNCKNLSEECEPCNECSSCKEIAAGQSLEVIEIDGASNRGIDDIRNINETLGYAPAKGHYKIFIIDEVHMLTKEAFNALLKSLEEPPENVKFFFATTEPQKVLPTIVSRCQRFDLRRIERAEIIRKLRSIAKELDVEVENDAYALIARLSEGSLRDGESLFDQLVSLGTFPITARLIEDSLGFATRKELFEFDEAYDQEDMTYAFDLAKKLFTSGRDYFFFIENLLEHYRNIALIQYKKLALDAAHFTEEESEGYARAVKIYGNEKLLYIIDYLADLLAAKNRLTFKKIHLEMTLLHILQSKSRISIDQIVAKLDSLEQRETTLEEKVEKQPVYDAAPIEKPLQPPQAVEEPKVVESISAPVEQKKPVGSVEQTPADLNQTEDAAPQDLPLNDEKLPFKKAYKQEASSQTQESPIAVQVAEPQTAPVISKDEATRHETLMRFAQVELNGVLKKNL